VVETAGVPVGTALHVNQALDASNNPHIVYYKAGGSNALTYAWKSGGVWTIEPIGGGATGLWWFGDITVDVSANPHVVFRLGADGDLYYTRKAGGVWTTEAVEGSATQVGGFSSLVLDASGNPHVCFVDRPTNAPYYARKLSGLWTVEPIDTSLDTTNFVGSPIALVLDASGNPKVAYHDRPMGNLKFASKSAGVWTIEVADGVTNDVGWGLSMALDRLGNPHVGYVDWTTNNLLYARKSGGAWTVQTADGSPSEVASSGIAVDDAGRAHIGYFDETALDARYARARAAAIDEGTGKLSMSPWSPHDNSGRALVAWPNPARGEISIALRVATREPLELCVFDASGRRVRTLGTGTSNTSSATWDLLDAYGQEVAAGTYFLRVTSVGGEQVTERVTILR
jgi:hypothetical protein